MWKKKINVTSALLLSVRWTIIAAAIMSFPQATPHVRKHNIFIEIYQRASCLQEYVLIIIHVLAGLIVSSSCKPLDVVQAVLILVTTIQLAGEFLPVEFH